MTPDQVKEIFEFLKRTDNDRHSDDVAKAKMFELGEALVNAIFDIEDHLRALKDKR